MFYRLREKKITEVEWKKAKEIADYLGISRPTLSKLTHRKVDPIPFQNLVGCSNMICKSEGMGRT